MKNYLSILVFLISVILFSQSVIIKTSQSQQYQNDISVQIPITWDGNTSGNYPELTGLNQTKVITFSPSGAGVEAFNHHPHAIEFYGDIHILYSTANDDEEEPGQYVRYQKSTDQGVTWSTSITLLESQDDITLGWTSAGRVCIPTGFAITDGDLYAVVDINDKGASNSSRTGVGVLAIKISDAGWFGLPFWIENVDGTTNAPSPIATYPAYTFDTNLQTKIRAYLLIPKYNPGWYFSVLTTDLLYSRDTFGSDAVSEPSTVRLPSGLYLKLWRVLLVGSNTKIAQISEDGITWGATYDTGVPDQPARTHLLQLNDNNIVITGNNDSTDRTPLFYAVSEDGLTYKSSNIYNIDTETGGATYSGQFKDTGVQYPFTIELASGKIFVIYSVNKEDIKISTFDKPVYN